MSLQDIKEQVKERADLAAIIGRHTKLVKSARGFKACCPLPGHKEKTPSFHIDTQKNYFYCYGCNRGGDVFTFLELVENLPFMEALRELAQSMNIEVPKPSRENVVEKIERNTGLDVLDRSAKFFHRVLIEQTTPGAASAFEYLKSRGITETEVKELRLGWAPESGDSLTRKISSESDLEAATKLGLIRSYDNSRRVDFFRSRMMIPITDVRARVIGFSGRILEAKAGEKMPKYINSSESEWFKKKTIVYGLDRASKFIRSDAYVCIVEGYFDQWALHRAEIPTVAVMGTALTEEHLELLGRFTKQVILVLDADAAGIASTKKSLPLLYERGWDVKVFSGFQGKDPDEWLRENPGNQAEIRSRLAAAPEGLAWLAKVLVAEAQQAKMNRLQIFQKLKDVWKMARNQAQKALIADELLPSLGLSRNEIRAALNELSLESSSQQVSQDSRVGQVRQSVVYRAPPLKVNARDRASGEALVWWLWNFEALKPKNEADWQQRIRLFRGSLAAPCVQKLYENWQKVGEKVELESLKDWIDNPSLDVTLRSWILKGYVGPNLDPSDDQGQDAAKALLSFTELSAMLDRERIRSEINALQSRIREEQADAQVTAQLLQEITQKMQELRISLENQK